MSGFAWAVICAIGALAVMALGDLLSEEVRGWLDLLPRGILRLAARRLDPETREAIYKDDWLPELVYALRGAESRPITRVIKGIYFSLGLLISARKVKAIPPTASANAAIAASAEVAVQVGEDYPLSPPSVTFVEMKTYTRSDPASSLRRRLGSRAVPGQSSYWTSEQQPDIVITQPGSSSR